MTTFEDLEQDRFVMNVGLEYLHKYGPWDTIDTFPLGDLQLRNFIVTRGGWIYQATVEYRCLKDVWPRIRKDYVEMQLRCLIEAARTRNQSVDMGLPRTPL